MERMTEFEKAVREDIARWLCLPVGFEDYVVQDDIQAYWTEQFKQWGKTRMFWASFNRGHTKAIDKTPKSFEVIY